MIYGLWKDFWTFIWTFLPKFPGSNIEEELELDEPPH